MDILCNVRVQSPLIRDLTAWCLSYGPRITLIFMNTRYVPSVAKNELLLHEAGHALGLVRRTAHASDYHCLDRNCLMNAAISMSVVRRLLGLKPVKQDQLCQLCEAELAENWENHRQPTCGLSAP